MDTNKLSDNRGRDIFVSKWIKPEPLISHNAITSFLDAPSGLRYPRSSRDYKYALFLLSLCLVLGRGVSCVQRSISAILTCVDLSWAASRQTTVVCPSGGALRPSVCVICPWEGSLRERGGVWVGVDVWGVGVTGGASGFKSQSASIFCTDIQHSLPQVVSSFHLPSWVDCSSTLPPFNSTPLTSSPYKPGPPHPPTPNCRPDLILPFHLSTSINCWHTSLCASSANASIQS